MSEGTKYLFYLVFFTKELFSSTRIEKIILANKKNQIAKG